MTRRRPLKLDEIRAFFIHVDGPKITRQPFHVDGLKSWPFKRKCCPRRRPNFMHLQGIVWKLDYPPPIFPLNSFWDSYSEVRDIRQLYFRNKLFFLYMRSINLCYLRSSRAGVRIFKRLFFFCTSISFWHNVNSGMNLLLQFYFRRWVTNPDQGSMFFSRF